MEEVSRIIERKYLYYNVPIPDDMESLMANLTLDNDELRPLVELVLSGSYVEALQQPIVQRLLIHDFKLADNTPSINQHFNNVINTNLMDSGINKQIAFLSIGISLLQLFIQANFTGPLKNNTLDLIFANIINTTKSIEEINNTCTEELIGDAEGVYPLLEAPIYLIFAKVIFIDKKILFKECFSIDWWSVRCSMIFQKIVDERSPLIYETVLQSLNNVENNDELLSISKYREFTAMYHLESIYVHLYYYDIGRARAHLEQAKSTLGIKLSTSGALGKRTKWQVNDLPQMVLKVDFEQNTICRNEILVDQVLLPSDLPKDLNLNDDVRLDHIKFKNMDDDAIPNFKPIEQAVILADLVLKRRSQAHDITLDEESKAYVSALLQHPRNWAIQMSSLLLRSQIEANESRAMERSMNQLEELVNVINKDEPSRFERSKLIYASLFLPQWELQQELAKMFVRLGCIKTALEMFERLHLWDDVITCYNELQMKQRSAELVRKLMEKGETPKLLCLLGDATDDIKFYDQAWELSKHKSYKSQRCLGNYYYVRKEFEIAIKHYEISVDLNKLQFPVWQRLAYSALQTENWELCAQAYRRCSVLEPDSFESWNNMSQAYLKLDQKQRAWKTLQEALRCRSDSWRLWDNFMLVSTSLGYMSQAIHAYNRILSLKEKHIDTEILGRVVKAIVEKEKDPEGREITSLHKSCSQLLGKLTREVPTNPELWYLYGDITLNSPNETQETTHIAMQYFRKSVAAEVQKPGWEKDTQKVLLIIHRSLKLLSTADKATCDVNVKTAIADLSSIRLSVKSVLTCAKRGQTSVNTGDLVPEVKELLITLENELISVTNNLERMRNESNSS